MPGLHDLAVGEVLAVVVDVVGDPLLGPGGRGLHHPAVLGVVVRELDGVEELVGRGDPQALARPGAELRPREVVVQHAVARRHPRVARLAPLRHAVAVEALVADVLEVHVELAVPAATTVGDRRAVAEPSDLARPDVLHDVQAPGDPPAAGRGVLGAVDPVDADLAGARALRGGPVAVVVRVARAIGGPGQQTLRLPALGRVQSRERDEQVAEGQGGGCVVGSRLCRGLAGQHVGRAFERGVRHGLGGPVGLGRLDDQSGVGVGVRREIALCRGGRDGQDGHGHRQRHQRGGIRATHGSPSFDPRRRRASFARRRTGFACLLPSQSKGPVGADVEAACHPVLEIFSIRAVVEMAGVRDR